MNRKTVVSLFLVLAAGVSGFFSVRLSSAILKLEPTVYAVFFWENSLDFALGIAAIFLLIILRLLNAYRPAVPENYKARVRRLFVLGLGMGALAAAIFAMRINRPVPPNWANARLLAAPLSEFPKHASKHENHAHAPVHRHGSGGGKGSGNGKDDKKTKLDGGKLVELDRRARVHARKTGKPILYYFRADWCPNCPDFERYVLSSPIFAADMRAFILVKMDLTDFENLRAYVDQKYGVHGTPTVVFRDGTGRIVTGATVSGSHVSYRLFGQLLRTARRSNDKRSNGRTER